MKMKSNHIVMLLLMPAFVSQACCGFFGVEEVKSESSVVQVAPVTTEEAPAEPQQEMVIVTETAQVVEIDSSSSVPEQDIELGEEYRSKVGGFSFSVVPHYELLEMVGMVNMAAPDAEDRNGPYILMIGAGSEEVELGPEMDIEDMAGDFNSAETGESEILAQEEIEVGGYPAQSMLFSMRSEDGEEVYGRVVMVEISDTQSFVLMASAPPARWHDELEPIVDAVIETVEFFEPQAVVFDFDKFNEEISRDTEAFDPYASMVKIRQWGLEAYASSEHWPAMQAIGKPDTLECREAATAWASGNSSSKDWLEVYYQWEVYPTEINIYQTHGPSQVVLVELQDPGGNYHNVYYGPVTEEEDCPYVMTITVEDADYEVAAVEVTVDQSATGVWNQIDAVELIGYTDSDVPDSLIVPSDTGDTDDFTGYLFTPQDVDPGKFIFEISDDIDKYSIDSGLLQDQSSPDEYALDLISLDGKHLVSLYIPTDVSTELFVTEYSPLSEKKAPGASLYTGSTLYYAQNGFMMIEVDDNGKTFSGAFSFMAYDMDNKDSMIYVDGAFNRFDLELTQ